MLNKNTFLIITSIAGQTHPILKHYAKKTFSKNLPFIVVGDTKSPKDFSLEGCDFYSVKQQQDLNFGLVKILPTKHYARKNLGYLIAISKGAEIIIETDDDNVPMESFWNKRTKFVKAHLIKEKGWVNVYNYFTDVNIWPRGFALEKLKNELSDLELLKNVLCPIQQGLADMNPDVDAIYRLILPLPIKFNMSANIALNNKTICPFNSQNTTWFKEAFPLLYLPSYCSFRMTDIWRSFIAQRIAWTCDWSILFHKSTVWQERNNHDLMLDFKDEIPGYMNNFKIMTHIESLSLKDGIENMSTNMLICYEALVNLGTFEKKEIPLLETWLEDIKPYI